jgi:hypothetical protein
MLLAFKLLLCGLERSEVAAGLYVSDAMLRWLELACLRSRVGVEEDVSVLEVLRIGSMLKVLLEGIASFDG